MSDLLATGSTWLAGKLQGKAAKSVTYTRRGQAVGSGLTATYGRTVFEQDSTTGVIRWESKDFIFDAADLTISSVVVQPENGDRITDAAGNVFEVLGDNGEPCFKYTDGHRVQVRVHTKQVSA